MNVQRPRRLAPLDNEPPLPDQDDFRDLAAAIREGVEAFKPAADAVVTLVGKFDALCSWIRSSKPWLIAVAIWALTKYAPGAAEHLAPILQGMVPQ
jgi:hypothetical protein